MQPLDGGFRVGPIVLNWDPEHLGGAKGIPDSFLLGGHPVVLRDPALLSTSLCLEP